MTVKNTDVLKACTYQGRVTVKWRRTVGVGCICCGTYCSGALYNMQYRHMTFRVEGHYVAVHSTHRYLVCMSWRGVEAVANIFEYTFRGAVLSLFLSIHKVLTYVEYRAVSCVFQNIDPPPLHPASVSSPRTKGGGYTLAGRRRGWGVNILEDASHRIGLLQYNLSTFLSLIITSTWARICRSFKETRYRFSAWRAGTKPYLSYWPAMLHRLAKSIPRNRFLDPINVYKYGLWIFASGWLV